MKRIQECILAMQAIVLSAIFLMAGCAGVSPNTNQSPDQFPNALMAEPVKLRAGFVHVTQAFEIQGPEQVWNVSLGFRPRDDLMPFKKFRCLVTSRLDPLRKYSECTDEESSIWVKWELIGSQDKTIASSTYNALVEDSGMTSSKNAYTISFSGFRGQPKGFYRLRFTALRDVPELDVTQPFILVDKPFFRKL